MNPAPLEYSISDGLQNSYDNILINTNNKSKFRHPQLNTESINNNKIVYQGHQVPLKYEEKLSNNKNKNSMFIFSNNKSDISCCPSTYSTSTGCVCVTKEQQKFISEERGGNVSYYSPF